MNNERFTVPELLFHPSDVGKISKTNFDDTEMKFTINSL